MGSLSDRERVKVMALRGRYILACLILLLTVQHLRLCSAECQTAGKFGENCQHQCNCNGTCDGTTGYCRAHCTEGFQGPTCQKRNVALRKTANSSSARIDDGWTADKAVDGDTRQDIGSGACFHSAGGLSSNEWSVDLGAVFPMDDIVIYYRTGYTYRFVNATILVASATGEVLCATVNATDADSNAVYRYKCSTYGSKLIIRQGSPCGECILEPCEVQVFVCTNGTYGQNCSGQCGHCSDGANCHHVTGSCLSGSCQPGYTGVKCDQKCTNGTYGQSCSGQCGHCSDGANCHHVTGSCLSCLPGYRGDKCDEDCTNGTYGKNCSGQCGHCSDGANCDHVTGSCLSGSCQPGYKGVKCDELCSSGYFGENCVECGKCLNNSACDVFNGSCPDNLCFPEFSGPLCKQTVENAESQGFSEGAIGGGVAAALAVLAVAILLLVLFLRQRRRGGNICIKKRKQATPLSRNDVNTREDREAYVNVALEQDSPRAAAHPERQAIADSTTWGNISSNVYANMPGLPCTMEASSPSCIGVSGLEDVVVSKKASGAFEREFEAVPDSFLADYDVSQKKEHSKKNKFKGYYPYDFNRVVLEPTAADPNSHYINASFVDGSERKKTFIASQASIPVTLSDFLRMIWQQKCDHVIMLTNLREGGKVKSVRYWPEAEGEELKCGEVTVTLKQAMEWSYCTLRLLTLTHESGGSLSVKQFHFTTWPDHGVPSHVDMLDFFWKVRASWTPDSGPLLVHCSAGVGRTGTFIALCILSDQAASQHRVDPLATLTSLRHQRRNMIQTLAQYEFLHEALVRVVQLGRTAVDKEVFCSHFPSKKGGLLVGNCTLDQLAQDMKKISDETHGKVSRAAPVNSNSEGDWDYFERSVHVSSTAAKEGFELVKLSENGADVLAPLGLWKFLLDTRACAVVDLHRKKSLVHKSSQEVDGRVDVVWGTPCSLEAGLTSRHLTLRSQDTPDVELEYISFDVSMAQLPGCVAKVASRVASVQLSTSCPVVLLYRPSEESCAQLLCAAVNLAESLRLDGHVELVNSLLRLHTSLDEGLVQRLAEVAYAILHDDTSVYSNE